MRSILTLAVAPGGDGGFETRLRVDGRDPAAQVVPGGVVPDLDTLLGRLRPAVRRGRCG